MRGRLIVAMAGLMAGVTTAAAGELPAGWRGWAIHAKGADPASVAKLTPEEREAKFAEWTEDAKQHWSTEGDELVNDGHGASLATEKDYGDVELTLDYKTVPKADSGIYLRGTPQVQIWDSTEEAKFKLGADKGSGGLWNNAPGTPGKDPLVKADRPFGEWNTLRIIQVGARTTVFLNGQLVVNNAPMQNYWDRKQPLPAKGPILLQTHGGEIRFRNIAIREIPVAEANALLLAAAAEGSDELFNGRDLAGWQGATDSYAVEDGAIVCKPKHGGNLFTADQYGDFKFTVEYQVPPGGNNGLAIRYPGTGDPAYSGMCEVQILDNDSPMYAKIDPRQRNGSAYGMVAARTGYQRPAGEWNVITVTAIGSTLAVELNGTEILNADIAGVTEFLGKKPHPGMNAAKGHLGFAGHNDPVRFRTVRVQRLDGVNR